MNLNWDRMSPLLPEYIHQQIKLRPDDWWEGWVGDTGIGINAQDVDKYRGRHRGALLGQYGTSVGDWADLP